MERDEVSRQEVQVAGVLRGNAPRWLSNREIAMQLPDVALRTIRLHTLRLLRAGLVDCAAVFPGRRYRWSEMGEQRNHSYAQRLVRAAEALGLS